MLRNYFTLYHFARELQELLAGGYVFEVYSQQKNEIILSLITNKGDHFQLVLVTDHPKLCISTRRGLNRKRRNTAGFIPEIYEKKILGVIMDPCDRIIRIRLEDRYELVLQLFSAKTNVFLEKNGTPVYSFKKEKNAARAATENRDRPDVLRSLEQLAYNSGIFRERFRENDAGNSAATLLGILPGFDKRLIQELLDRCAASEEPEILHKHFSALFHELLDPQPSVVPDSDNAPRFSILPSSDKTARVFTTVIEGLNFCSTATKQHLKAVRRVKELESLLRLKKKKIESELVHFQPEMLQKQMIQYERNGHLLMANLYNNDRKKESITVENILDVAAPSVTISLKAELDMQQNAEAWFQKASRAKAKLEGGKRRKAVVEKQKQEIDSLTEKVAALRTLSEVEHFERNNREVLKMLGLEGLEKNSPATGKSSPYRRFTLSKKAVLYVGKNAGNNEQLTFGFAKPHDIWLHARGASGSHCVLRGSTMQNIDDITKAAQIAAYYSAAKHAGLVPVLYTEKKYVRRSNKMSPGQVVVEREKVILVQPFKD